MNIPLYKKGAYFGHDYFPQVERLDKLLKQKAEKGEWITGLFLQNNEDCHVGQWADFLYKMIKQAEKTPKICNPDLPECPQKMGGHVLDNKSLIQFKMQHTK